MTEIIFAIIGFIAGLFVATYNQWFSHNLNLSREKKKQKFELFRKFAKEGANIIVKTAKAICDEKIARKEEAQILGANILLKFDFLEELKLFTNREVLLKVNEFKDKLILFLDMQMEMAGLIGDGRMKMQELAYFLHSISDDSSFKDQLEELGKDKSINTDVFSFFKKYASKENYYNNLIMAYLKVLEMMQKEL